MTSNNENFYKRMREIAGISSVNESNKETPFKTLVDYKRANNGTAYGVVKENHQYHIKKALVKEGEVKITDFTYIDGVENKTKFQYNSLAEADKQRNLYIKGINEAWDQGGVYIQNEKSESPRLDVENNVSSLLRNQIIEGKKNIAESREKRFKSSLAETNNKINKSRGLMPESADIAVKKALGILTEESAMVTADSEIKDSEILANKKGKENSQAPIDDTNAKSEAEKANAKGTKHNNTKFDDSKSIAVNQEDAVLKEENDLSTADSHINSNDSLANHVNSKHEPAQAPINDTNAKSEAEKANAASKSSEAISNNVESSVESDPFDKKENAGDEKGDIVTESNDNGQPFDKNTSNGSKDLSTTDSDQKDNDRVDNKSNFEKEDAKYNNHNQPEIGHKEEKGEELKPIASKKDIVAEETDLSTADSEIQAANALANMTNLNLPNDHGKSEIVADSDMNPDDSLANDTKTNLPNPIAEGKEEQKESDPFDDKENAGDEKGDIVAEDNDLSTADSEINKMESVANETDGNITYDSGELEKGTSFRADDNKIAEAGEEDLNAAASALDDLDVSTANDNEEASEVSTEVAVDNSEEPSNDDQSNNDENGELDQNDGDDAPESNDGDLIVKEIEKLIGKTTQKIRTAQLEPETAEGFLKSIVSSFEDKLPEMDISDRKEVSDKILNPDEEENETESSSNNNNSVDSEEETAIDTEIDTLDSESSSDETQVEEDAPMNVTDENEKCNECGTFETYMESRGYDKNNMSEYSMSEMANLVSGYANAYNEGLNDGDFESVAGCVNDDVVNELKEYGHESYANEVMSHMKENNGVKFGMVEPTLSPIEEKKEDMDGDGDIDSDDYLAKKDAAIKKSMEGDVNEDEVDMSFAPAGEVMSTPVNPLSLPSTSTKTVDIDLNNGSVSVQVNENDQKLKKYVKDRLEILSGRKKDSINESTKGENLKKLDKLIEQQWNEFNKMLTK